jgi:hypothetical protein
MAQSPSQLEVQGYIKPGAGALVNNLVQGGKTIQQALTPNLFTGKDGVASLSNYVNNPTAQVAGAVVGLQQAQTALTQTGLITGKESGTQLAGLVMSAATAGVQNTVNFVSNAANSVVGAVNGAISNVVGAATGALNSVLGSASSLMSAGNFAGNLASTVTGGLSSIAGALGGMAKGAVAGIAGLLDSAKGVAGSAFAAITGALPTLKAGVPQNIKDITEKAQAAAQAPVANPLTGALGGLTGGLTGALGAVTGGLTNAISGAVGAVTSGLTGAIAGVAGAASGLIKTALGTTANLSTGLGALPGGASVVASVVNNAAGAINNVPGVSAVTGLIGQANAITNGIAGLASGNPLASSGALSAANGIAGSLTKGLDDLKSGKLSLATLASAGLPAGAAAQLNAAISSMSSGGAVQIKLPTVAVNTTDRSELTSQVTSLLGDAKIPAPNYGGTNEDTYKAGLAKLKDLQAQLQESKDKVIQATAAAEKAKQELPAGDPAIQEAEATAKSELLNGLKLNKLAAETLSQIKLNKSIG